MRSTLLLAVLLLLLPLQTRAQSEPSLDSVVRVLRSTPPEGAQGALEAAGFRVQRTILTRAGPSTIILRIVLAQPSSAARVARELGITRACGISTDVHQRTWSMFECRPYEGRRLAADPLRVGAWDVVPRLQARPGGPLPQNVAGASPAYDLRRARANVVALELRHGA